MPLPKNRSRSVRRMPVRTPTGRKVMHYKAKKRAKIACCICGSILGGVKNTRRASKSEKLPTRIFAGQLCSGCTAEIIKMKSRIALGEMRMEDASQAQREYIKMVK